MPRQRHDNDYYLKKLRDKHKGLYADILAGKLSVPEARKLAGLGGTRTRLHELKNAWTKATPQERADFLRWASLASPPAPPPAGLALVPASGAAFDADGTMLSWARRRVKEVLDRRKLAPRDLADELGIRRLDQSVMTAVTRGTRIRSPVVVSAVEAWLLKNASV